MREEDVLREAHNNNMYAAADKMLQYRRNLSFFLIHLLLLSLSLSLVASSLLIVLVNLLTRLGLKIVVVYCTLGNTKVAGMSQTLSLFLKALLLRRFFISLPSVAQRAEQVGPSSRLARPWHPSSPKR